MAVRIRLARHGRKKKPYYRVVAADSASRRDGRYLELLGTLNPLTNPPELVLKEERIRHWVGLGAKPSDTASQLIEKVLPGYLGEIEEKRKERIRSRRAKRKARAKTKTSKAA